MAAPNPAEHVERGDVGHELNKIHYDATSSAPVAGFSKCDDMAGAVGSDGEGGDHFSSAEKGGGGGPWKQT